MSTIKKKVFKKMVMESKPIVEFIDDDGGIISGDEKYNAGVDVKTNVNTQGDDKGVSTTTDDHAASAIQPRNWWWSLTYGYGQGTGHLPISSNISGGGGDGFSESIDESELTSEQRMKKMVEDIMSKKSNAQGFVKKNNSSDVNRNNIPDIEELSDTKMIIVSKLEDLIESIGSSNLSGDEVGIVLNYLLSKLDTSKISSDYKNLIKKQL